MYGCTVPGYVCDILYVVYHLWFVVYCVVLYMCTISLRLRNLERRLQPQVPRTRADEHGVLPVHHGKIALYHVPDAHVARLQHHRHSRLGVRLQVHFLKSFQLEGRFARRLGKAEVQLHHFVPDHFARILNVKRHGPPPRVDLDV